MNILEKLRKESGFAAAEVAELIPSFRMVRNYVKMQRLLQQAN